MLHRTAILVGFALAGCGNSAFAQAWVPDQGEGTVSILYQDLFVKDHFMADGVRRDQGSIDSANLVFDVTYGLTDRIAVTFAAPLVSARYSGRNPHPTAQDDGARHAGFQDLRFNVRYNLARGAVAITPFVGTTLPTHAYEYFAHAAYGPRMRELEVGSYIGYTLDTVLPNAFVQARLSYSFPEEIAGVKLNRSNLSLEFGYFLTPRVRVFTIGSGHKSHGGIDLPAAGWRALPAEQGPHHDRIGRIEPGAHRLRPLRPRHAQMTA